MPPERLPKQALLAKTNGRRPVGRPRTRWTDYIEDLEAGNEERRRNDLVWHTCNKLRDRKDNTINFGLNKAHRTEPMIVY